MRTLVLCVLGALLVAAVMSGCRTDESPVSPVGTLPATSQAVDQRIVGTWCDAGAMDAIEFRTDGTWRPLYVYGMMVHDTPVSYYDTEPGGRFTTTADGMCIRSTASVTFSSPTLTVDTLGYTVTNNNATLTLVGEHGASRNTYARLAVGDMVR